MALIRVKEILKMASDSGFGVPAINVFNYESVRWAALAAEQEKMPVIIQFFPGYTVHVSMKTIAEAVKEVAKEVNAPIGLHLDHARDFATAMKGIKAGFESVMIDGSALPFDENVQLTSAVRKVADVFGVDVEAELGHVGSGSKLDDFTNPNRYTDPMEVKRFIEATGADSLAIAVGNGHGRYVTAPKLDFERISAVKELTDIPLVMHGGSDIPEDQIQESVIRGICKFNIATEYGCALYKAEQNAIAGQDSHYGVLHAMESEAVDFVREKIKLLNPRGWKMNG